MRKVNTPDLTVLTGSVEQEAPPEPCTPTDITPDTDTSPEAPGEPQQGPAQAQLPTAHPSSSQAGGKGVPAPAGLALPTPHGDTVPPQLGIAELCHTPHICCPCCRAG